MGIRLEGIIMVMIIVISAASYMIKVSDSKNDTTGSAKELEFYNTTFIEVDPTGIVGKASTEIGIRESGILTLKHLTYQTKSIDLLRADRAIFKDDKIYLDGNISLKQKQGFDYRSEHAIYDKKSMILKIMSPFEALFKHNLITGDSLEYNSSKREVIAYRIHAILYMSEGP